MSTPPFSFLLLPQLWSSANRARRRERGDFMRAGLFGIVAVLVSGALFYGAYWLTSQLSSYEEFGDYLLRLGLSWLFLTFLAFLAFSGVVTSLSTFFLADDLRRLAGGEHEHLTPVFLKLTGGSGLQEIDEIV